MILIIYVGVFCDFLIDLTFRSKKSKKLQYEMNTTWAKPRAKQYFTSL